MNKLRNVGFLNAVHKFFQIQQTKQNLKLYGLKSFRPYPGQSRSQRIKVRRMEVHRKHGIPKR